MRKYMFLSGLLVLLTILQFSCRPDDANKGVSPAYRVGLLDSLLNAAVNHNEIPGAVACIVRDGRVIYHKAVGWRNLAKQIAMEEDDIFRMASMTKGLTAVAILQLCEKGLLFLDEDVSHYLPEFRNPQVLLKVLPDSGFLSRPSDGEITIRQLLTHTSGIGYGFQDSSYNALIIKNNISEGFEDDDRTSLENIQRLARIPLLFEPGERYTYGLSYDVLGVVIEKVSGMRYDEYITKNILLPLGMVNSHFLVPEEKKHRLVSVYQPSPEGNGVEPATYPDTIYPVIPTRRYFSGGADLCSTAEDYARFVSMVLNHGSLHHTRIIGKRYIDMMLSKQTTLDDGDSDQGFAAWVTNTRGAARGPMSLGSYGFGGFFDTYAWADPESNFVAVLLLQMYPNNQHNLHRKFQQIVYGTIDDL